MHSATSGSAQKDRKCAIAKVRSLFKDGKQTAGCSEFCTETGLRSLVSVQKFVHPAVCLQSLKEKTDFSLTKEGKII